MSPEGQDQAFPNQRAPHRQAPGVRAWVEITVVFTSLWPKSACTVRMS